MKISAFFLICLFVGGCSQISYFSHTSDTENRDPVIKPILETKEIADLNKEEDEIATAIIVSILNSKAFVLAELRKHNSEVKYNIILGINEKNPSNYLLKINCHSDIKVFSAHEGILRDGYVYQKNPKDISEFISISDIVVQNNIVTAEVFEFKGPLESALSVVRLQKVEEKWIIQSWQQIWVS